MNTRKLMAALLALPLAMTLALPAVAQSHDGHMDHAPSSAPENPATDAYREANERMHEGMMLQFTGVPDVDFVRGMIIHHEGALEMAQIVLEHGTDPEIRKLAEEIVAAQEEEITMMREWLAAKGY